jgi:hypothetical protein
VGEQTSCRARRRHAAASRSKSTVDISSAPGHIVRTQWRRATVGCSQSKQGFRDLLTWATAASSIMANTRAVLRMVAIVVVDGSSLSVGKQHMAHIVSTWLQ